MPPCGTPSIAQLRFEVGRALPVGATPEIVTEVAHLAVNGFGGTEAIRIAPPPGIADVTELGVRRDGTSIYPPPNETRYALRPGSLIVDLGTGCAEGWQPLRGCVIRPLRRVNSVKYFFNHT
jgi:hypothetical protein